MRGFRGLWYGLVLSGLTVCGSGCGDAPTPTPGVGAQRPAPVQSPAAGGPTTVTGVPVQNGGGGTAAEPPTVETPVVFPPPSVPVDGFEAQDGWFLATFGNPGTLQKFQPVYTPPAPRDQTALLLSYQPGDKNKACIKLDRKLSLKPDGKVTLTVYNHAPADLAIAFAFSTGDTHEWFESKPQVAAPGWNTLSWNFNEVAWKSAASQWQHTVAVGQPSDVRAIHLLAFNEQRTGDLTVSGVIVEAVRPAPPAPPPTAAVDWDSFVAQLPVNPRGKQTGLQAGAWINDMTGDPARVLIAPNALNAATDRMLVLDWAAAGAPAQRKAGFVAAKQVFAPALRLDKTGALALDVYNTSAGEAAISVGVISGDNAVYHESKPFKLAPQAWTSVQLPLNAAEYKSAATNWEPTGSIADADKLTGLVIKSFTTPTAGRLAVTALTAPVVTPPPSPQPLPPVTAPAPDAAPAQPAQPAEPAQPAPDAAPVPAPADPAADPTPPPAPAVEPPVTPADPMAGPQ